MSSTTSAPPVSASVPPAASAAQSNGDSSLEKAAPTGAIATPNPAKVNVWAQRAQARALGSSVNTKAPSSAHQPGATSTLPTDSGAPGSSQNQLPTGKSGANGLIVGSIIIDEQEWPEVGPSSGVVPTGRSDVQARSHVEKEAEHSNPPTKKGRSSHIAVVRCH
jgi:hypothetical protein